jgi:hypothetical protein
VDAGFPVSGSIAFQRVQGADVCPLFTSQSTGYDPVNSERSFSDSASSASSLSMSAFVADFPDFTATATARAALPNLTSTASNSASISALRVALFSAASSALVFPSVIFPPIQAGKPPAAVNSSSVISMSGVSIPSMAFIATRLVLQTTLFPFFAR